MRWLGVMLICMAASLPWSGPAFADAGQITHLSGALLVRRADGQTRFLSVRSEVREGDILATPDNSYARVRFTDGSDVVLRSNSQLRIDQFKYEEQAPERDSIALSLIKGGMRSITGLLARRNADRYKLATPTATVGIRGTVFGAQFCNNDCAGIQAPSGRALENGLHLDVSDGRIVVTTQAGSREFGIGEFGFVANLGALPVQVPPEQGFRVEAPRQTLSQSIGAGAVGKTQDLECAVR